MELFALEKCHGVITQNVDNLHQESGLPEELIVELHGNATYAKCLNCGKRYQLDLIKQEFENEGSVLPCQDVWRDYQDGDYFFWTSHA